MELLGKAVLIKPDALPEKTDGGIIIPKTTKEPPNTGRVVKVGHACTEVGVGNRVHYARKVASIIKIENVDFHIVFEDKIFYIE